MKMVVSHLRRLEVFSRQSNRGLSRFRRVKSHYRYKSRGPGKRKKRGTDEKPAHPM